ncbi:hypothetical protein CONLIGDRAFT_672845 [Coniochaeta ligniaria NRRL 30616]|uniref:Xylanolytic transcriptional activator regulatory domain-containing protein n=1 Tax=Coniochaeta ligniaria NRRL 30616 TaxID=1408157 RepID=A0A1J7IET8_9PEZI|nr:hypothetical protein CONLIGDRAFT_672845 [Coniochaeta ligniaria NRRL 30616]
MSWPLCQHILVNTASLQWQLNQQLGYETDSAPGTSGQTAPEHDRDAEQVTSASSETAPLNLGWTDATADWRPEDLELDVTPTATSAASETAPLDVGWTDWAADWRPEDLSLSVGVGMGGQKLQLLMPDIDMTNQNTLPLTEPTTLTDNGHTTITDHMRADLDQVFFDRVQPVLPIIHRRRYFSWADQENPGAARACLRSAMRTMAAAMSAPGCRSCDQLYAETCRLLQAHTVGSKDKIVLEYIQAWLLLGHYELLRVGEYQAMLTAGFCFRLVLMARLSDIDAPGPDNVNLQRVSPVSMMNEDALGESASAVEEQRRTFWLAFCLDRFLCSRNEYPLILQEEMICTRLPAPEANFQNNQQIRTSFLAEAMSASHQGPPLSPFAECIVLATLHGRCMAHRRSYTTKESHGGTGDGGGDFWTRQKRLASAAEKRVQVLGTTSSAHVDNDPMLFFAHMLAHSAVIKLGHTAQRASSAWHTVEQQGATAAYKRRASSAAAEMVRLAKQVPSFSCFKAHPFLPDPLACAASFLTARRGNIELADDDGVLHLLRLLRDMQGMNSLARGYFVTQTCDEKRMYDCIS